MGQTTTEKKFKDYTASNLNFSSGIIIQSRFWGEIGLNYGTIHQFIHGPFGNTLLVRASTEFTFVDNEFLLAPKIGIQKSINLIDLRLSFVRYYKSNIPDLRLNPEIVLDMQTFSYAFGWNIRINDSGGLGFIPNTKFSMLLNF